MPAATTKARPRDPDRAHRKWDRAFHVRRRLL